MRMAPEGTGTISESFSSDDTIVAPAIDILELVRGLGDDLTWSYPQRRRYGRRAADPAAAVEQYREDARAERVLATAAIEMLTAEQLTELAKLPGLRPSQLDRLRLRWKAVNTR